ncbi:MAG: 2-oxo acid dehydrogenase subunit E2 [Acidobacteria bacterium]|nr:2-oxo acid dehydrogenase subunit E2 [Acidobacteriota bacterium]
MAIEITVPRLGWSSEEGVFAGWLKQPGETVVQGEPLFALESDKVTMDVESLDSGILQVLAGGPEPGGTVTVGQVLGHLLAQGESVHPARQCASPRARAAARKLGIDIATVSAAPGANRVVEADVLRVGKPRGTQQVVAARLEESFRAPHFYVQADADAEAFVKLRGDLLPILEKRHGVRVTYNDLLVKAAAMALDAMPQLNCYWRDGTIMPFGSVDVSLAVQAGDSLLAPVIRNASKSAIAEIAAARGALVEKCQQRRAVPEDLRGGSMTVSNLGPFGVDRFQAILNPPQPLILAVGRIAKRPVVDGDRIAARTTVPLSLSVDHRVINGVAAAQFLQQIVSLIESPLRLVL